jgi:hypothetical protein
MSPDILAFADLHDRLDGTAGLDGPGKMSGHRCLSDAEHFFGERE